MSFADLFKPVNDLFKFNSKRTVTFKTKTAGGVSLKSKTTLGKGMNVESKFKNAATGINFTKVAADTDGHFDVEAELANVVDGCVFNSEFSVGSDEWQSGNSEKAVLGLNYVGMKDLDLSVAVDVIGQPQATLSTDVCYSFGDFTIGADAVFQLPFSAEGGDGSDNAAFAVSNINVATKYTTGDFQFGLNVANPGKDNQISANFLHTASSDFKWGALISQTSGGALSARRGITSSIAAESNLDAETTVGFKLTQDGVGSGKFQQVVSKSLTVTYQATVDFTDAKIGGDQAFGIAVDISA